MKTFAYQNRKDKNYFEGWYVRLTDEKNDINVAIIFAITKDKQHPHSFIQYYDGTKKEAFYYEFTTSQFQYDEGSGTVHIGDNFLSTRQVFLKTADVVIEAKTEDIQTLQPFRGHQSAMGYLQKAPLECFQEVIYLDTKATFTINDTTYHGRGYMEKTYGTNFPKDWIWLQSNHSKNGSKISFSVGLVPVLFFHVKGFFLIYHHQGNEYRYGSYNLSHIKIEHINHSETTYTIRKRKTKIIISAKSHQPVKLVGPSKNGVMNLDVFETLTGTATMKVYNKDELVFEDTYYNVGLELMYNKQ
jgi:hypothetical protein